jgi:acyl-CoA synthetase (AMP-forming)/AMP-acid ligase II
MDCINDLSYPNTTLAIEARKMAQAHPTETALYFDDGTSMTYGYAYNEALKLAGALQKLGLQPGDMLSFQLPNTPESVIVAIAASLAGLLINPIVPIYRDRELAFILEDAKTRVLFIPTQFRSFDFTAMLNDLRGGLPQLTHIVAVGPESEVPEGFVHYQSLVDSAAPEAYQSVDVDPNDTKIVLYTSGTTGKPKAVQHSHNTLAKALANGATGWSLTASDLMLMPSPVTHITGYVNGIELPFCSDTKALLMSTWVVDKAVALIEEYGATVCVSATPFLRELVDTCRAQHKTLPGFRLFACGGASVPPQLIYDVADTLADCTAVRVYGSTETPLVTVGFPEPENTALAAETDGRIHNYEVIIVDDQDNPVADGEEGEILVRGPAMMLGYAEDSQNDTAFNAEGFFRTGDIGKILPSAAVVITDRKKDIIIRGGENLSAREIEEAILAHPDVAEAAVVAAPHERLGEGVAVFVIPRDSSSAPSLQDLLDHMATQKVAKQKWPQHLEIVTALPKTASGKVQKERLRQQLKDQGVLL